MQSKMPCGCLTDWENSNNPTQSGCTQYFSSSSCHDNGCQETISTRNSLSQSVIICIHIFELSKNMRWEYAIIFTLQLQNIKIFYRHHDLTHGFGSYHTLRNHLLMSHSLLHLRHVFKQLSREISSAPEGFVPRMPNSRYLLEQDTNPMLTPNGVTCKSRMQP